MRALITLTLVLGVAQAEQRIVSLGGGITETLFALGVGEQVVGVDTSSVAPPAALKRPKVGYVRQTSAEGIASLKPTLVIAPPTLGPPPVIEQLAAAKIRLEQLPDAEKPADAVARVKALGELVGKQTEAARLAADIEAAIAEKATASPRVLFIFVHGGASLQVSGTGTGAHAMITAAGGRNAVDGYDGYRPLTAEALVAAKPDVVLVTPRSLGAAGGPEGVWKTPGLALTPAGKARRLVVVDDLALLGFGPRTGAALRQLREGFRAP